MSDTPEYRASGNRVYKEPVRTKTPTGTSISIGFPVLTISEYVTDPEAAAKSIAMEMNTHAALLSALQMVATSGKFTCFDDAAWDQVNSAIDRCFTS